MGAVVPIVAAFLVLAGVDGDRTFKKARAAYDQLDYEAAAPLFDKLAHRTDLKSSDRAIAFVWLALSDAGSGNFNGAQAAFDDAAKLDPNVALPVEVSARLQKMFADAKASVAPPPAPAEVVPTPPPTPAPTPSPTPAATTVAPAPSTTLLPMIGTAAGTAIVAAGVGAGVLCATSFSSASDRTKFGSDAKLSLDAANLELTVAAVLLPAGAIVAGGSGFLWLTSGS